MDIGVGYDEAKLKAKEMLAIRPYTDSELCTLIEANLLARRNGELPDEWFWADVELLLRK